MRDVEGVKDAAVDIVRMELVVTPEGSRVDLDAVIRAIRGAGFETVNKGGPGPVR